MPPTFARCVQRFQPVLDSLPTAFGGGWLSLPTPWEALPVPYYRTPLLHRYRDPAWPPFRTAEFASGVKRLGHLLLQLPACCVVVDGRGVAAYVRRVLAAALEPHRAYAILLQQVEDLWGALCRALEADAAGACLMGMREEFLLTLFYRPLLGHGHAARVNAERWQPVRRSVVAADDALVARWLVRQDRQMRVPRPPPPPPEHCPVIANPYDTSDEYGEDEDLEEEDQGERRPTLLPEIETAELVIGDDPIDDHATAPADSPTGVTGPPRWSVQLPTPQTSLQPADPAIADTLPVYPKFPDVFVRRRAGGKSKQRPPPPTESPLPCSAAAEA